MVWYKFQQKPREEQAENENAELSEKAGFMFGISGAEYAKALCQPRVKVGNDYVIKGDTFSRHSHSVISIGKVRYS